ncbi:High-affinity branched-chain amino acid transport ATP-binding protein LivF [Starkeya nomas]|uniref:High-affinity branched-chain amino acid transport ATP-binding protein LivF n=1 Tax=Starkeya nomas TaxID=2666134 RepID=A0A5S9R545_9HYPH|nr:ABC transporter ATP-binding protein [Starkeya nomas]CAA0128678.1 High-affinity branched-chain amino acid transport ATP-binding protein LivF [Starkeya nomas]
MSAALTIDSVSSGYGGAVILREASLAVAEGEIVSLVGKNGMGKSTLLKTIMGFVRPRAGRITLFGADITGVAPHLLAGRGVSYTPQELPLFADLTVEENLRIAVDDRARIRRGVEHMSSYFPFIAQRLKQRAGTLSGGEQKMLLVSRTLMSEPRLLLIDEISEGLQPSMIERLRDVLLAERARAGLSLLLVEQHVSFALALADRYAVLKLGEIVDSGPAKAPEARANVIAHLSV